MSIRVARGIWLWVGLGVGGCVDVPERTRFADAVVDGETAPDQLTPEAGPPDTGRPADVGGLDAVADGRVVDMAVGDAGRVDGAGLDAEVADTQPPDMQVPDVAPPDVQPPDAGPVDRGPPDMGPGLRFSGCLAREDVFAELPADVLAPCVQVAEGAPMPEALSWRSGVALSDGRVVLVGGLALGGVASNRVDVYDPEADAWSEGPRLPSGRWAVAVARVQTPEGDAVMVLGGAGDVQANQWMAIPDVLTWSVAGAEAWARTGQLPGAGLAHAAAWSDGEAVTLIGGQPFQGAPPTDSVTVWQPGQDAVERRPLIEARYGHGLADVRGQPMVVGGAAEFQSTLPSAELLEQGEWLRIGDDRLRRVYPGVIGLDDVVLVSGGRSRPFDYARPENEPEPTVYDRTYIIREPVARPWEVAEGPTMSRPRFAHGVARLGPGVHYTVAIGGEGPADPTVLVEVFDLGSNRWWPLILPEPAAFSRSQHTTLGLPDGRVVVAGGIRVDGGAALVDQTLVVRLAAPAAGGVDAR